MKRRLAGDVPGDTVIFKRSKEPDSIPLESCEKILEKMESGIRAYYTGSWPVKVAPPRTAEVLYREWKRYHNEKNTSRASQ